MPTVQKKSAAGPQAASLHRMDPSSEEYKRTHVQILDSLHQRCTRQEANIEALTAAVRLLGGKI